MMSLGSFPLFPWFRCHRIAAGTCLVTFHAVNAAEGNRACIREDTVDDADGLAIHRAFFIDSWSAFSKDGRDTNDGEE